MKETETNLSAFANIKCQYWG